MSKAEDQYNKVRAKVDKGVGVVKAIAEVAKAEKVKPGTIQTAYYRIARQRGTTRGLQVQNQRIAAARKNGNGNGAGMSTDLLMQNIVTALRAVMEPLTEVMERVTDLEQDSERLHEIEGMLTH